MTPNDVNAYDPCDEDMATYVDDVLTMVYGIGPMVHYDNGEGGTNVVPIAMTN